LSSHTPPIEAAEYNQGFSVATGSFIVFRPLSKREVTSL
jgi:hypothetical protein